jgi:outer membrane lipopolysaccharide assembly protein LptE/RlpB
MKKILLILIFIIISSCGFKVLNLSEIENYNLVEINLTGEKKINYIIKNNLLQATSKNADNNVSITIDTKKNKTIKEKNIKNEITKYDISIMASVFVKNIYNSEIYNFTISKNGNYAVEDQNSATRNNEKKLITLLSMDLADEILSKTRMSLNDL